VAYRFSGRVDEAEDLTQDIFVKVYQNLDRFKEAEGAFPTWLATVARHHAIDHYRRRRKERLHQVDPEILEWTPSNDEGPLRGLERDERVRLVRRGLRSLPAEMREVLVLYDLEGLSYDEIASILSIPMGTVKSRVNRGRLELARRLVPRRPE